MKLGLKRVYEKPAKTDGQRVLVDRLWPRGLSKEKAAVDVWLKEIAPSSELRTWFGHDPAKWYEFQARYTSELEGNPQAVKKLRDLLKHGSISLLYGAKDIEHAHALVLKRYLEGR